MTARDKGRRRGTLSLTRSTGQAIRIGRDIRVVIMGVEDGQVRLGIEADRSVEILREELVLEGRAGGA